MKKNIAITLNDFLNESKKNNKSDLFYHGSSDINFDDFNKHEINYFTQNYDYAKKYTSSSFSALRFNKSNANNGVFTVKLKCKNIFDTKTNPEHRKIFLYYTNNFGNGTPITDSGYPDWSDVEYLSEYLDEKKYKFDCIILQDAFGEISYATIGKNKVEIINKESI